VEPDQYCGLIKENPLSSAVATTVNSANLVSYPLRYNHVPLSVSGSSPYNSISVSVLSSSPYNSVPVSESSLIGSTGVSANITSLPQPAPIMLPQTTDRGYNAKDKTPNSHY
jgi:hypothetical protein